MMDDDSGESTEVDEVAGVGRDESELEWLVRGRRTKKQTDAKIAPK